MQRAIVALFGATLMLCPPDFRKEYGSSIRADFVRAISDERTFRGPVAAVAYALIAVWDLVATAFTEYFVLLSRDLSYAFRALRRTPLFTAVIVATLAIAIGANVAVFSIMHAVVLAPLPYAAPGRLVAIRWLNAGLPAPSSLPDYADLMRHSGGTFAASAAFTRAFLTLTGKGDPHTVDAIATTVGLFDALGTHPELGRFPAANETRPGAAQPVVLSDALWHRAFDGDPRAVGSIVRLDGESYHVVGIAPAGVQQPHVDRGFYRTDLWTFVPENGVGTKFDRGDGNSRGEHSFDVIARLAPGVSMEKADAFIATGVRELRKAHPSEDATLGSHVVSLSESLVGSERDLFFAIFAAVGAVLLVACANVANLLLSRAVAREREFSVRIAVGASSGRIVMQLLVESFVLAVIGGAAGIVIAYGAVDAFVALHPANIPRADDVPIDGAAILFTLGIIVFCTLAAGLAPALTTSRRDVATALKSAGRGGDAHRGARARDALVAAEIAMTLALVVAAGLVVRSFIALTAQPLGFDATGIEVVGRVDLPARRYATEAARDAFYSRALATARAVPGVRGAAWMEPVPFSGSEYGTSTTVDGRSYRPGAEPQTDFASVGFDFFRVLHASFRAGRPLTDDDRAQALRVVVVNETYARANFPGGSAIGAHIRPGFETMNEKIAVPSTIVGVVADLRNSFLRPVQPTVYIPLLQMPLSDASLLIEPEPGAHPGSAVAAALGALDPLLAKAAVAELSESLARNVAAQRFSLIALSALAIVALALAAAGIFAVVSFGVTQRTHEFGIRMALGASAWRILGTVLLGALRLASVGIVFGLLLSALCTRFLGSQLYETAPLDPLTFAIVTALVILIAVVAALVPASRATRVDPIVALRYE